MLGHARQYQNAHIFGTGRVTGHRCRGQCRTGGHHVIDKKDGSALREIGSGRFDGNGARQGFEPFIESLPF